MRSGSSRRDSCSCELDSKAFESSLTAREQLKPYEISMANAAAAAAPLAPERARHAEK